MIRRWTLRGWLAVEVGGRAVNELGELALVRHRHAALRRRALLTTDTRLAAAARAAAARGLVDVTAAR